MVIFFRLVILMIYIFFWGIIIVSKLGCCKVDVMCCGFIVEVREV